MPTEVEMKFRLENPAIMRERLIAAGAVRTHDELETNWIFDTPQRELLHAARGLRIRCCVPHGDAPAHPATITFKGPPASLPVKRREEIELEIRDPAAARRLLENLGYRPVIIYEKRRQTWELAGCIVTVDELPRCGDWMEIEGPSESAIRNVQCMLQLSGTEPVRESYVAIAARLGETTDVGVIELRFDAAT